MLVYNVEKVRYKFQVENVITKITRSNVNISTQLLM